MAPSQHLRPTPGRTRTSRLGRPGFAALSSALALSVALALSACGNQSADAAAIVDGNTISDKDVQNVSRQINAIAPSDQQFTARNILLSLIVAPYVSTEAIRAGKSIPDTEVLKAIDKVAEPSLATVDFVRMRLAYQTLDQPSLARIATELSKAKVTINPRYGAFDPKQLALVPLTPNWIKTAATPDAKVTGSPQ